MGQRWNLGDARDRLSQLVQDVLTGEQITICKNGEPLVDLVPTRQLKRLKPQFGRSRGTFIDPNWNRNPETDEEVSECFYRQQGLQFIWQ